MMLSNSKKGQVAIFIILGMILLIITVILIYLFVRSDVETTTPTRTKDEFAFVNSASSCIDQITEQFLTFTGKQGGVLYEDQQGYTSSQQRDKYILFSDDTGVHRVQKGVINRDSLGTPPNYPYNNQDAILLQRQFRQVWGEKTLTPLCDFTMQATASCPGRGALGAGTNTIQGQLKAYLERNMASCVNDQGEQIISNSAVADIRLGLDDITVFVANITDGANSDITRNYQVRLKRAYTILSILLDHEIEDIEFDKTVDIFTMTGCGFPQGAYCSTDGIVVSVVRDVPGSNGADIVRVTDEKSLVKGQPLTLYSAVVNRRPLINFQYAPGIPDKFVGRIHQFSLPGDTLTFVPQIFDPDEDDVAVEYRGWQEGTTIFNESKCCQDGKCVFYPSVLQDQLGCYNYTATPAQSMPQRFPYDARQCEEGECFSFVTDPDDRGVHQITVEAYDEHGNSKYNQDFASYLLFVGREQDELWTLEDYVAATVPFENRCTFIYDTFLASNLRQPDLINFDECATLPYAAPPTIPNNIFQINDTGVWRYLDQCPFELTTDNIDHVKRLTEHTHDATKAAGLSVGGAVTGCFYSFSRAGYAAQNFYTADGSPFTEDQDYHINNFTAIGDDNWYELGSFTGTSPLDCVNDDDPYQIFLENTPGWKKVTYEPYEVDGTEEIDNALVGNLNLCKYEKEGLGCGCWLCETDPSAGCHFYISYK